MIQYRTKAGETLDWICWKHYGRQSGVVETVLKANPGLADYGAIIPRDVEIILPDLVEEPAEEAIELWT